MNLSDALVSEINAPYKELSAKLEGVVSVCRFMDDSLRVRPRLGKMLNWENLDQAEQELATSFISTRDVNDQIFYSSLYILSYGVLEAFIRKVVERAVEVISKCDSKFEELPVQLQNENIFRTGVALQSIRKPSDYYKIEYYKLVDNLGTCVRGNDNFILNCEVFSFNHGVLTPDNIDKLFARIGIEIKWDTFGGNPNLKSLLGETRTRDCTKSVKQYISESVKKRNVIAHTGMTGEQVTKEELDMVARFISLFADVLYKYIADQIEQKYG